jgi:hypothetical protein
MIHGHSRKVGDKNEKHYVPYSRDRMGAFGAIAHKNVVVDIQWLQFWLRERVSIILARNQPTSASS